MINSIIIKRISTNDPWYQSERELRNQILLRPIGLPDYGWEMHDAKSWHFVALERECLVGCVVLVPLDSINHKAQLIQMAVAQSVQRKGIGTKLIQELLKFATLQG
ncbi:MAG TPA: GNAT family N-acetyltransferase, partial [Xenococcaceae cyanobacterium]